MTREAGSRRPISVLVRALPEPAAAGEVVGTVEVVDTGEVVTVRDQEEFVNVLRRLGSEPPTNTTPAASTTAAAPTTTEDRR